MPTIFSHPAVAIAAAPWFRPVPRSLILLGGVLASVPDVDVAGFRLGIPYGDRFGHRGFTHSILFALIVAAVGAAVFHRASAKSPGWRRAFLFLLVSVSSHGLLDAMTTGGKGVGFFIPFSNRRYFLPFRPIRVSPIGATHFAADAHRVLLSELRWVWLPCLVVAGVGWLSRARSIGGDRP